MMLSPATIQQSLVSNMGFDTRKDLAPIILIGWDFNILVVTPSLPATSVQQLIDYLKANPDKVNYASGGNGTPATIISLLYKEIATIMGDAEVRERITRSSTVIDIGSPEMMGKLIVSDVARWAEVIKKAGIQGN